MSNEKEIGAVEWLVEQFENHRATFFKLNDKEERVTTLVGEDVVEQAKEMQKKQHANTWDDSRVADKGDNYVGKQKSFNDYYEETYGGNK